MNQNNYKKTSYNQPFIEQRADPYMYKHTDGMYYFTGSVPEYDRIVLRGSKSIEGLKDAEEHTLWKKHEQGPQSIHIWAPELHYLYGEWYIYYAAGDAADVWAKDAEEHTLWKKHEQGPQSIHIWAPELHYLYGEWYIYYAAGDAADVWAIRPYEHTLWKKHEQGPQSIHIWAPELHYLYGEWYIYYAAGDAADVWAIRPYVLHCKGQNPLEDEWEEMGMMQTADGDDFSFRAFSLDATVFENKSGIFIMRQGMQRMSGLFVRMYFTVKGRIH